MDIDEKSKDIYSRQFISTGALGNSTLLSIVEKTTKKCAPELEFPSCWTAIYTMKSTPVGQTGTDFTIKMFGLDSPPFITNYSPRCTFTEFVIQFLSCFGIWLTIDFTSVIGIITMVHKFFATRIRFK